MREHDLHRSSDGASSLPPTATTTGRSSRTSRPTRQMDPTSSGWRTSPTSPSPTGFVYVAVILDAWSRRVVGYAISRSIDARLTSRP